MFRNIFIVYSSFNMLCLHGNLISVFQRSKLSSIPYSIFFFSSNHFVPFFRTSLYFLIIICMLTLQSALMRTRFSSCMQVFFLPFHPPMKTIFFCLILFPYFKKSLRFPRHLKRFRNN